MKIMIAATHPIQYHVPWFRALQLQPEVELEVLFGMLPSASEQGSGFGVPFAWDIPMLDGYRSRLAPWRSKSPKRLGFFGTWLGNVEGVLDEVKPDVVIVTGWQSVALLQVLWASLRCGTPVVVRGESSGLRKRPWFVKVTPSLSP